MGESQDTLPIALAVPHYDLDALFDDLRDNRLRPLLRLEQESIGFGWVRKAVFGFIRCLPNRPPLRVQPQWRVEGSKC